MAESSLPDAAALALDELLAGRDPDADGYRALRASIIGYLVSAWPGIAGYEAQDVADEALARILVRVRQQSLDIEARPLPYVLRTARNLYIDRLRRAEVVGLTEDSHRSEGQDLDDRDVLRLLDADATLSTVRAALTAASDNDDTTVEHVVSTWLDLAQEIDEAPSDRAVARRLGVDHSTVSRALKRFRGYLVNEPE